MADWVAELFPPTFPLSVSDLNPEDPNSSCGVAHQTHLAGENLTDCDVSRIRNVYERVRVMCLVQQQQEDTALLVKDTNGRNTSDCAPVLKSATDDKSSLKDDIEFASSSTVDDSCIWDQGELTHLRRVFKAAKLENSKLKHLLGDRDCVLKRLRAQYTLVSKESDRTKAELAEALRANQRLHLQSVSLEKNVKEYCRTTRHQNIDKKSLQTNVREIMSNLHSVRVERDKLKLHNQKLQFDIQAVKAGIGKDIHLATLNVKTELETEVRKLKESNEEIVSQLEREKSDHERTRRGLEILRRHFSSVKHPSSAVHPETQPSHVSGNATAPTDELPKLSFY